MTICGGLSKGGKRTLSSKFSCTNSLVCGDFFNDNILLGKGRETV